MPDPRLVSRAQRAATMLERAWDHWRAAHGLAAEPLPPVSSYVGYSIEEPWGRPRVVFGVDAADAERLATLLQDCAGPQQALVEARARIPAQGGAAEVNAAEVNAAEVNAAEVNAAEVNGAREPGNGAAREHGGTQQAAGSANGFHPVDTEARPEDPTGHGHLPEGGAATDVAVESDGSGDPAAPASAETDVQVSAPDGDLEAIDVPAGQDGLDTPDASGRDQRESSDGDDGEPGEDASAPQAASDTDDLRAAGHGVADTMAAELAGWAARRAARPGICAAGRLGRGRRSHGPQRPRRGLAAWRRGAAHLALIWPLIQRSSSRSSRDPPLAAHLAAHPGPRPGRIRQPEAQPGSSTERGQWTESGRGP